MTPPRGRPRAGSRAVLALPRLRPLLAAAFVGRLPIGDAVAQHRPAGSQENGSYATAGRVAATQASRAAIASPLLGRLIDRVGQTPVLVVCGVGVPAVGRGADRRGVDGRPDAAAAGRLRDSVRRDLPAAVRRDCARCSPAWRAARTWPRRAFALEAIVQELFFITGPLLVALLVAVASPQAALGVRRRC